MLLFALCEMEISEQLARYFYSVTVYVRDVVKYISHTFLFFFQNLCDSCVNVHMLLLLSCVYSQGLGLDLGNSLDQREGESTNMLIHESQSFRKKKRDCSYLTRLPVISSHGDFATK